MLEMGLTYIKKNAKPEKKVDLRLVVNAGSILKPTTNKDWRILWSTCVLMEPNVFQNQLVDYLQSIVKFGQHLNAYTSFDETFFTNSI
jgi:zinc protease